MLSAYEELKKAFYESRKNSSRMVMKAIVMIAMMMISFSMMMT